MTKTSIEDTQKLMKRAEMFEPLVKRLQNYFKLYTEHTGKDCRPDCYICKETEELIRDARELL
jgi:hypothetical protein